MSALARYFQMQGYRIAGYDLTATGLTKALESEGIVVYYEDRTDLIPEDFQNPDYTTVVYTPAIPDDHQMLQWFRNNNFEVIKRAAMLGKITQNHQSIAVAGTHGKTSIGTFLAHLLYQSSMKCNAFLGGISANYNTNMLFDENASFTVIEADEYDRSFLHLNPVLSLISSIDADHLDIYGSYENIVDAFNQFVSRTFDNSGKVIVHKSITSKIGQREKAITYSIADDADYYPVNMQCQNGYYNFDLVTPESMISNLELNLAGNYNFENAVAAAALACEAGIDADELKRGMASIQGVERRFQLRLNGAVIYIDDYAHHPAEIAACINSARHAFPGKTITIAFQPHLYSRTKDFYREFAQALNQADRVYLLPIYPAREAPIEGISSRIIAGEMPSGKCSVIDKNEMQQILNNHTPELFISMGAGDIGHMAEEFEQILKKGQS